MTVSAVLSNPIERVGPVTRSDEALIGQLRAFIPQVMHNNGTPGLNIALARHGQIVWEAGFGLADIKSCRCMTPDTVFHSGSLGKSFIATAIMQLDEQGVLSIDDPVNQHLPFRVDNPLGGGEVLIRDLLSHRSGLAGWDQAGANMGQAKPLADYVRAALASPVLPQYGGEFGPLWQAPTRSAVAYSSLAFAILGLVIEQRGSGEHAFVDHVNTKILDVLGMDASQFPIGGDPSGLRPEIASAMSTGYMQIGGITLNTPAISYAGYPGQGYYGTPGDQLRLLIAMLNGGSFQGRRLLKQETVRRMLEPQSTTRMPYVGALPAIGWMIHHADDPKYSFSHSGSYAFGWRNTAYAWPHHGTALVVSANQIAMPRASNELHQIVECVATWLPGSQLDHEPDDEAQDWDWKLSYIRGLMFVEATNGWLGFSAKLPSANLEEIVSASPVEFAARSSWNREGFLQGVSDMRAVEMTRTGIRNFLSSSDARVTQDEIEKAFLIFGTDPTRCLYPTNLFLAESEQPCH